MSVGSNLTVKLKKPQAKKRGRRSHAELELEEDEEPLFNPSHKDMQGHQRPRQRQMQRKTLRTRQINEDAKLLVNLFNS